MNEKQVNEQPIVQSNEQPINRAENRMSKEMRQLVIAAIPSDKNDINGNVHADKVVRHNTDGSVSFHRGFFYRHGMNSKKWLDQIIEELAHHGLRVIESDHDEIYAVYPKDSYWDARIINVERISDPAVQKVVQVPPVVQA